MAVAALSAAINHRVLRSHLSDSKALLGLRICLYPADFIFYLQDVELDEPKAAGFPQSAQMGLSRDGVLRLRADPTELIFRLLNVDNAVATRRVNEAEHWRQVCRKMKPMLSEILGVLSVVPDRSERCCPSAKSLAEFQLRMLQAAISRHRAPEEPAVLPVVLRIYHNDQWSRILGMPAAAMVYDNIMDVRVDCTPSQLWAALKALRIAAHNSKPAHSTPAAGLAPGAPKTNASHPNQEAKQTTEAKGAPPPASVPPRCHHKSKPPKRARFAAPDGNSKHGMLTWAEVGEAVRQHWQSQNGAVCPTDCQTTAKSKIGGSVTRKRPFSAARAKYAAAAEKKDSVPNGPLKSQPGFILPDALDADLASDSDSLASFRFEPWPFVCTNIAQMVPRVSTTSWVN